MEEKKKRMASKTALKTGGGAPGGALWVAFTLNTTARAHTRTRTHTHGGRSYFCRQQPAAFVSFEQKGTAASNVPL